MDYHIFLSHASKDKDKARLLAKDLQEQGFRIWFDSDEIEGGEDWIKSIEEGIDNSSIIIVIWTEFSSQSKWVEREIARADQQQKEIIPLRFDDTKIPTILLQRIQYIDFQAGYLQPIQTLISRLNSLIEVESSMLSQDSTIAWRKTKQPFYRSRFLEQNNYLNYKAENFALHDFTKLLIENSSGSPAEGFITLVAVPIPDTIDADSDILTQRFKHHEAKVVRFENPQYPWQYFNLSNFYRQQTSQRDYLLHHDSHRHKSSVAYIRFNEDGAIEFTEGTYIFSESPSDQFQGEVVNFTALLGSTWKFITLAVLTFAHLKYFGEFQLLINLRNTQGATLAGFAGRDFSSEWSSRLSKGLPSYGIIENKQGLSQDKNLQFIYNINTRLILQRPEMSEDIIVELSKRLQLSFNYPYLPRHYISQTKEFPWQSFSSFDAYSL